MSVAALPPPSLQPRMPIPPQKRPVMQPRPPTSAAFAPRTSQVKNKSTTPPALVRRPSSASSVTPLGTPVALPAPAAGSSKDTSSSSGKVFAKPSKEWVLPERAKPGRKVSAEEPDNKRQSQNRLSQRAHRARRTDYIQTLEERLRQYEADEIHSNVRLQEVARALKADNERLKQEILTIRMDLSEATTYRDTWDAERTSYEQLVTRLRGELAGLRGGESSSPEFVRPQKTVLEIPLEIPSLGQLPDISRRPTMDCPICPDPDPDCPCQQKEVVQPLRQPTAPLAALHLAVKAMAEQGPSPTPGGDSCGICQTTDDCLCSIIEHHDEEDVKPNIFPSPSPEMEMGFGGGELDFGGGPGGDGCGLCTSASFCACRASAAGTSESPGLSTMSSLPSMSMPSMGISTPFKVASFAAPPRSTIAVPLKPRRRGEGGESSKPKSSIWSLDPPTDEAVCSGDPSNCDACKNDTFGKEFCESLFDKADTAPPFKPCTDCPGNCMSIKSLLCSSETGETGTTAHSHPAPTAASARSDARDQITSSNPNSTMTQDIPGSTYTPSAAADTMTCDQAWKTLKAHPNSRYASLSLLADVVAGRTICTGPQAARASDQAGARSEIGVGARQPGAGGAIEAGGNVRAAETGETSRAGEIGGTGWNGGAGADNRPPVKKRNMAVESSAVRDALRLLDRTTPVNSPMSGERRVGEYTVVAPEMKRRRVE